MEYTEEQISENYNNFIELIKDLFTGERQEKLLHMYSEDELGLSTATAPASAKEHFHNAYVGGYLDHVMNIYRASKGVKKLWQHMGCTIDFTDEELYFSVLHHDLGKVGDTSGEYYIAQDSAWHMENRGEMFKFNPDIQFMNVTDRALYLLQLYGIEITQKEFLAIKLSDGIYEEANKKYYISYDPNMVLKTNLPYIVHQSDFIACRSEYDKWKNGESNLDILD